MTSADCIIRGCRRALTLAGAAPRRGAAMRDPSSLENAWLAGRDGRLVFVGDEAAFRREVAAVPGAVVVDGDGLVALPGFVDAHTHLPFAGRREAEFKLRLDGATYQELAARGMGILTTVRATRAASREELVALCLARLDQMLLAGTTTVEAKSGYGLDLETEIRQLEALREAAARHPVDIVPTFMGAHEIPPEYRGRKDAYIRFLVDTALPEIRRRGLAEFCDVFCEEGVFSLEDARFILSSASSAGFKVKIHADEFVPLGGSRLAAEAAAVSAEHLIAIPDDDLAALAASPTAAVLLPGVSFFLRLGKTAPARRLVDAGAVVALATDFNPGSSMLSSMLFVWQLGVYTLGLGIEEALAAATINGAYAVDRHRDCGSLEVGKKMDVLLCDVPDYVSLVYHLGVNPIRHVIKAGRVVVRDGRLAPRET